MYSLTHLPNPQKGEHGIQLLRRHWFTFFLTLLLYIFLAIMPLLVIWVLPDTNAVSSSSATAGVSEEDGAFGFFVVVLSMYYFAIITFFFHAFLDFYLDVWVVTTERIIAIEQKGLFSRVISEQKLYRVQDVTSEVHGFFPTVLKYGNVFVQTAAEEQRFIFKNVPQPDFVVNLIHERAEICKNSHNHYKEEI